jgi:hypothetical protein
MPDYNYLMGAQVPQVDLMGMLGKGMTLGNLATENQLKQLQLQQLQANQGYWSAATQNQQGAQPGQGPSNPYAVDYNALAQHPMAAMTVVPALLKMQQEQTAADKNIADAAEARRKTRDAALAEAGRQADNFLGNPDAPGAYDALVKNTSQLGIGAFVSPPPDPSQAPPAAIVGWAKQLSAMNPVQRADIGKTSAETKKTEAGLPYTGPQAAADLAKTQAEGAAIYKPEIKLNTLTGNYEAIYPMGQQPTSLQAFKASGQTANQAPTANSEAAGIAADKAGMPFDYNTGAPPPAAPAPLQLPTGPIVQQMPGPQAAPTPSQASDIKAVEPRLTKVQEDMGFASRIKEIMPPLVALAESGYNGPLVGNETGKKILAAMDAAGMLTPEAKAKYDNLRASDALTLEVMGPMIKEMSTRGGIGVARMVQEGKPGSENSLSARIAMAKALTNDANNIMDYGTKMFQYRKDNPTDFAMTGFQQPSPYVGTPAGKSSARAAADKILSGQ